MSLRIALVLKSGSVAGGASRFEEAIVQQFEAISTQLGFSYLVLGPDRVPKLEGKPTGNSLRYRNSKFWKFLSLFSATLIGALLSRVLRLSPIEIALRKERVDLIVFASPNVHAVSIRRTPFIATVWDFGHREMPFLPEYADPFEYLSRETYLRFAVMRAFKVWTESEFSGHFLETYYGVSAKRWKSLGMALAVSSEGESTSVLRARNASQYFLYPAQFWPHKNHVTILEAHKKLIESFPAIQLVLVGSEKGHFGSFKTFCESRGFSRNVQHLGFVPDQLLAQLMRDARAVLMPSLIGPTNIPPLEAVASGTPTIVSDAHHFDEDLGPACLVVERMDSDGWKVAMERILTNEWPDSTDLRAQDNSREIIEETLNEFIALRLLWIS